MARIVRVLACATVMFGIGLDLGARLHASDPVVPTRDQPPILLAQKALAKKKKAATSPAPEKAASAPAPAATTTASDSGMKFSRDIAPILVGNCIRCHNPERKAKNGKFDLTTFEKLMAGSDVEKVIVPGKPDESHLVLRLRGEETPKMPQGNNNNLSEGAIAKIEEWVKAGALLDAGIDRKALLKSYAPTPEDMRVAELKKLSAEERDKMVETVALKRWKQASPKDRPEVTPSTNFLLFSTLPKDRATTLTKGLETAYTQLKTILSRPRASAPALDWPEKTSVFVFNNNISFVEFVRTLESRELEPTDTGTANFGTKEPYLAVVDPLGGREDSSPSVTARKSTRSRKGDDGGTAERTLSGLLAEQLAIGVLKNNKNTPNWLCLGVGAYFATALDPRSSYTHRLRSTASAAFQQGWTSRATDALGGELKEDETRAISYGIVDWMTHDTGAKRLFPAFVRAMIEEGGSKLDDVLQDVFGTRRQDFLYDSGLWVSRYGSGR